MKIILNFLKKKLKWRTRFLTGKKVFLIKKNHTNLKGDFAIPKEQS